MSLAQRINDALPQTQCTRCGYPDCESYAQAIADGQAKINQCPPGGQAGIERLAALTGQPPLPLNPEHGLETPRSVVWIDENWCIGCTLCIEACPTDAIIGTHKRMHTVIEPYCTGCELCLPVCPVDCIEVENASGDATGLDGYSATALRRATAKAVDEASKAVESFRFNVAVAKTMELVNATRKAIDGGLSTADPAVREAVEAVAIMMSLVAPYTSEDMWSRLGHQPAVALAGWPTVDPALLVDESVTCIVQIAGKVKERLEVSPDISEADLQALAMASPAVLKALEGREVRTVIVRAPKLVNIVL